jgi:hypothetical protein
MSRGVFIALALLVTVPAAAQDRWTVAQRVALPMSGAPIDLAILAGPGEEPVRIALTGSYSFAVDGSRIDAFGAHSASRSDVAEGAFVILPPGAQIVARDPLAHRYELEIPRSGSMPVAFNVLPLAMRHLMTASEARASLTGAIELEHLVPPAPDLPMPVVVAYEASALSPLSWAGGGVGLGALFGLGLLLARRRRDPMLTLLRRAQRARRSIASECAILGPAFDPVAASTLRLFEAAERSEAHRREVERAIARTQWATSATAERARLHEQSERARLRIVDIVTRLEQTATTLAGRRAEAASATGVETLLGELGDDLDAAVSAEEDVARI